MRQPLIDWIVVPIGSYVDVPCARKNQINMLNRLRAACRQAMIRHAPMTFWPTRYVFGVRVYRGLDFDKNLYYEEQQAAINARVRGLPQQPGTQMTWTHQRALQRGNTVAVRDSGDERRALQRAARKEAADAARKHWLEKRQSNRAVSNRL